MEWVVALEASNLGAWMRGSAWAYPVFNLLHVGGLVMLVGSMMLLDLRILGVGAAAMRLSDASDHLTPFAVVGLMILLPSGFLLFAADASPLIDNPLFLPKLALVSLGILNALLFRQLWNTVVQEEAAVPGLARFQAFSSLLIWILAASLGRLLAYV